MLAPVEVTYDPHATHVHGDKPRITFAPAPYRVSLSAIRIPPEAKAIIAGCLDNRDIGQSAYVEAFEQAVAAFVGARFCIATSSGTMADAVACAAMREHYSLSRAVVPALTFIAQPNAARMALPWVQFVDVREDWTLDLTRLESLPPSFVFPTHLMGRLARVDQLPEGTLFIEDACEAFGSTFNGQHAGTFGKLGTYSFFVSHTVTMGEGGAIVTDDEHLAALCRRLRSHGRASESDVALKFKFPLAGFNAKMSGLTAALGMAVMRHAAEYVAERRSNFGQLNALLGGRFVERPGEQVVPHGYPIKFFSETARDAALVNLLGAGVECRKFFSCVPHEGAFKDYWPKNYPVAEHIGRTHLYVPCHHNLDPMDIDWLAEQVLAQKGLA